MYAVRIEASGFNDGHSRRPFSPSPSAYPDDSDFAQEIVDAFAATDANFGWLYLIVNDAARLPLGGQFFREVNAPGVGFRLLQLGGARTTYLFCRVE
ncbi:hypothetical protein OH76DRAFT_1490249 [Lentinus brumalis]|uniref:Uncharacterized protein n=1 Tax=Lentinus brumalis TaxID=2498619 RepID=A0A371CJN9_9APHY|nr:hypothetical protein OH76DRAFT_1490249 [Polyporus brumalis]